MERLQTLRACDSLIAEHRQVEGLLDALQSAIAQQDISAAQDVMKQLVLETNTHFACEERVLFPAVSAYHSMVLMEVEHELIIDLRNELSQALDCPILSWETAREIGQRFIQELLDHIAREDHGIFPICEKSLSDVEKSEVIAGMDALRAEAEHSPIPAIQRPPKSFQVMQADIEAHPPRPIFMSRLSDERTPCEIKQLVILAGQALSPYWSPQAITIVCLKGMGHFEAQDQQQAFRPGTVITLTPQLTHTLSATADSYFLLFLSK